MPRGDARRDHRGLPGPRLRPAHARRGQQPQHLRLGVTRRRAAPVDADGPGQPPAGELHLHGLERPSRCQANRGRSTRRRARNPATAASRTIWGIFDLDTIYLAQNNTEHLHDRDEGQHVDRCRASPSIRTCCTCCRGDGSCASQSCAISHRSACRPCSTSASVRGRSAVDPGDVTCRRVRRRDRRISPSG